MDDLTQFGIKGVKEGKLIINISSEWCMPCKTLSPVLEEFKKEGLIELIQIDIMQNQDLKDALEISTVPTLLLFKDGKLLDKDISVSGQQLVNRGVMIGATGELILREIIKQM